MRGAHRSDQPAHTHVVVAVKDLSRAKTRLAESLSASDRTDLVVAMLRDTLSVLVGARDTADPARITDVTVVTPDPVVASIAAECGVGHLPDPARRAIGESGLNAALTDAERALGTAGGAIDVVALQADLPALRTAELLDALGQARRGGRSIVVDHTGTGTSALFACGPSTRLDPSSAPTPHGPTSRRGRGYSTGPGQDCAKTSTPSTTCSPQPASASAPRPGRCSTASDVRRVSGNSDSCELRVIDCPACESRGMIGE